MTEDKFGVIFVIVVFILLVLRKLYARHLDYKEMIARIDRESAVKNSSPAMERIMDLEKVIEQGRRHVMSEEEREQQAQNFAAANVALDKPQHHRKHHVPGVEAQLTDGILTVRVQDSEGYWHKAIEMRIRDSAQLDSARLDWLDANPSRLKHANIIYGSVLLWFDEETLTYYADIRQAIDAGMKPEQV